MGYDVFANAVYGVIPEGPFYDRFLSLVEEVREAWGDGEDERYYDWEEVQDEVFKRAPDLKEELYSQYQAPDDVKMIWTGDQDDRPGRCATPPDIWILGYRLGSLPLDKAVPESFRMQAQWHTWVEGG